MLTAKKIRIYPTKEQEKLLWQFAGTSRWAWNESLAYRTDRYNNSKINTSVQQSIEHIQDLKYNNKDYEWVQSVPEAITKQAIKDLDRAYKDYLKGKKGKPKFKKKGKCAVSFYQRTDNFHQTDDTHIKITGIKKPVKIKKTVIPKNVSNTRISYDNKYWYLSYSYETEIQQTEKSSEVIGIDLGLKDFATASNGKKYKNINKTHTVKKIEKRKKHLQRKLSHKYELNKKGTKYVKTNNIKKLEQKIRLIDRHLANIRNTYIHNITKELVRTTPAKIVIEDLNVKGMMKNKHLAEVVSKQGFYKFRQYLSYKCELADIELTIADKWYPSSKICSNCGQIKKRLSLAERTYSCEFCKNEIDRDLNAAINLSRYEEEIA